MKDIGMQRVKRFIGEVNQEGRRELKGNAIKKNINVRYEIKGRIRRKEVWDYPVDAIREAVLNAVCHRDYRAIADTQIKIYDDYIHIWNPGELPHNISIDDLLNNKHISSPRNKLVTQAFYGLGSIERLGSGIERILNSCRVAGMPAPEFREEMNLSQIDSVSS